MKQPQSNDDPWRGFFIVSAIGADLVVCLGAGYFIGRFLGRTYGHDTAWIIGGALVGLLAGIGSVILLLRSFAEGNHE